MQLIDIAMNLIDERERLGYSRKNFAAQTNISGESLRLYETGKVNMSAEFLLSATKLGVDIQYLFTGIRSENLDLVSKKNEEELNKNIQNIGNVISGDISNSVITTSGAVVHHVGQKCTYIQDNENAACKFINDEQIEKLQFLVKEIIDLESSIKKKPRTSRSVWQSLNAFCNTTSYKFIETQDYKKAEDYLIKWIGQLSNQLDKKKHPEN